MCNFFCEIVKKIDDEKKENLYLWKIVINII